MDLLNFEAVFAVQSTTEAIIFDHPEMPPAHQKLPKHHTKYPQLLPTDLTNQCNLTPRQPLLRTHKQPHQIPKSLLRLKQILAPKLQHKIQQSLQSRRTSQLLHLNFFDNFVQVLDYRVCVGEFLGVFGEESREECFYVEAGGLFSGH